MHTNHESVIAVHTPTNEEGLEDKTERLLWRVPGGSFCDVPM